MPRYTVRATDEQAIVWGSRVHALGCRTVEQFLARCADAVCTHLKRFDRRMEREERKREEVRRKELARQAEEYLPLLDAALAALKGRAE
jgi:hypothetical protein